MQAQAPERLQDHVGHRVRGVFSGLGIDAADRHVLVRVVRTGDRCELRRAGIIEALGLQDEGIYEFLRLVERYRSRIEVFFQVRPGVLVHAAEREGAFFRLAVHEQVVQQRRLTSLPECASGTGRDPC